MSVKAFHSNLFDISAARHPESSPVMNALFRKNVPNAVLRKLAEVHRAFVKETRRFDSGTSYCSGHLDRVIKRFERYRGGNLSDVALMRREVREVYAGGLLDQHAVAHAEHLINRLLPGRDPEADYSIHEGPSRITIDDVSFAEVPEPVIRKNIRDLVSFFVPRMALTGPPVPTTKQQALHEYFQALTNAEQPK
jgi:uncharacterized protein YqgQ